MDKLFFSHDYIGKLKRDTDKKYTETREDYSLSKKIARSNVKIFMKTITLRLKR